MTSLRTLAAVLGAGLGLGLAGAAPAAAAPITPAKITDSCPGGLSHCFAPASLSVAAGTTVVWSSSSGAPHTVTCDTCAPGSGPSSGEILTGQSYQFTFTTPGTYAYHCDIHPYMTASVVVTGAPATPPPTAPPTPRPTPRLTPRPAPLPTAPPAPRATGTPVAHPAPAPPSAAPATAAPVPTAPPTAVPAATPAPTPEPSSAPVALATPGSAPPAAVATPASSSGSGGPPWIVATVAIPLAVLAAAAMWWVRRARSEGAADG
ncbi:MAG TPA: plastocyanin/azurin family copper-binding protein [Candidatus Dormibacteraeota bacterium]|jgi:plastocyanin|nr:plastocyanin/azurin family copper-binding protein [Candidatus Dormibacteraeota bacterium]